MLGEESPVRHAAICVDEEGVPNGPALIWIDDRFWGVVSNRDGKSSGTSLLLADSGNVWFVSKFDEQGRQIEAERFESDGAISSRTTFDPRGVRCRIYPARLELGFACSA